MQPFIGRERELEKLRDLERGDKACLVVIKGRRRIGKSRLAAEFAKDKRLLSFSGLAPVPGVTAQNQRDVFARQFSSHFNLPPLTFTDWSDAFSHLTLHLTNKPTVILLDEISWIGSEDPTFIPKLKNWWDLEVQKFPHLFVIFCGSVSIWIEKNILNSTAFFGRVTQTITLEELNIPTAVELMKSKGVKASSYDFYKLLSIMGGVPWYLEQVLPHLTVDENIKRLCFEKEGLLTVEFDKIFHDLFKKSSSIYKEVIQTLSDGMKTLEEIRKALDYSRGGSLSEIIKSLITSGFISGYYTWTPKTGKEGKSYLYRLSDNYIRFFLKYIEPNLSKIEKNSYDSVPVSKLPGFESMLGLQLETLLLKNRNLLLKAIGIHPMDVVADNPYRQNASTVHSGCQIDYLIQSQTQTLYLCEFKFSKREIGNEIIEEMRKKEKSLTTPKGFAKVPVLFHLGGVSDSLYDSKYFFRIIDLNDFLE